MEIRVSGKVVEVEYGDEQISVARQHEVKAALKSVIAQHGAVGLLVHAPPLLRQLDVSVGSFWMGVMRELAPAFRAWPR